MADTPPSAPRRVHPDGIGGWVLFGVTLLSFLASIPALNHRARTRTLEMAAIGQLVTIQRAQARYFSRFTRFAHKLEDLGPTAVNLIPADLAKGIKGGYQFTLVGGPTGYTINANPVTFGTTGRRTFFSDQSKVVRENWGQEPATVNSPEIK
jgi:hypothetical protein